MPAFPSLPLVQSVFLGAAIFAFVVLGVTLFAVWVYQNLGGAKKPVEGPSVMPAVRPGEANIRGDLHDRAA